jgi:crossover junction endodeoxyribonuclease RuvC
LASSKIILGIDCGTAITGWAILEASALGGVNRKLQLKDCGIITTHKYSPEVERLKELGDSIGELISEFQPTEMAIEDIFFFKNAKTVIKVSQARGVVIYKAVSAALQVFSYTPLQIKQTLTGHGRADKAQMMSMVNRVLGIAAEKSITQDDAADAVAVGYCHYLRAS